MVYSSKSKKGNETRSYFGMRDFRERAAMFDHNVRGAFSPPLTPRAPGFATQDHAQARDSNAAQDNTQNMEATSESHFGNPIQERAPARPEGQAAPPHVFNLSE